MVRILGRDRAVVLAALAAIVGLSWATLLRSPSHAVEMPPAVAEAAAAPLPTATDMHAAEAEPEAEEDADDGVPRFP
jgi:predicted metal-binding membrane protein